MLHSLTCEIPIAKHQNRICTVLLFRPFSCKHVPNIGSLPITASSAQAYFSFIDNQFNQKISQSEELINDLVPASELKEEEEEVDDDDDDDHEEILTASHPEHVGSGGSEDGRSVIKVRRKGGWCSYRT